MGGIMAIRDASLQRALASGNTEKARLLRAANQQWDMADLARKDRDMEAAAEHIAKAKDFERQARELED
jgi:hypothetical protein